MSEVLYEVSEGIATLTLNRPDQLNAWTAQMNVEFNAHLASAEEDPEVKVIIITGTGERGFCAGADMSLLQSISGGDVDASGGSFSDDVKEVQLGDEVREDFRQQYSFLMGMKKPVICAVNGAAVGLGMVNALYCDVRFASETARFSTTFAQRGLIAEYGLAWLLPRMVGQNNALDMLLSARLVGAEEAKRMGLVSDVFAPDELLPKVRDYALQLVKTCSPRSMQVIKRMAYNSQFETLEKSCKVAVDEMMDSLASPDFMEGVASFLEKRPPNFPSV